MIAWRYERDLEIGAALAAEATRVLGPAFQPPADALVVAGEVACWIFLATSEDGGIYLREDRTREQLARPGGVAEVVECFRARFEHDKANPRTLIGEGS